MTRLPSGLKPTPNEEPKIISLVYWSHYQLLVQSVPITAFCDRAQSRGLNILRLPLPIALIAALSNAALCSQTNSIWDVVWYCLIVSKRDRGGINAEKIIGVVSLDILIVSPIDNCSQLQLRRKGETYLLGVLANDCDGLRHIRMGIIVRDGNDDVLMKMTWFMC